MGWSIVAEGTLNDLRQTVASYKCGPWISLPLQERLEATCLVDYALACLAKAVRDSGKPQLRFVFEGGSEDNTIYMRHGDGWSAACRDARSGERR